uniref:Uncharacterized protein n=1 Tax=Anguilla anguilla TaxID=7936 RepID=A0A0E9QMD9_ANGAN
MYSSQSTHYSSICLRHQRVSGNQGNKN